MYPSPFRSVASLLSLPSSLPSLPPPPSSLTPPPSSSRLSSALFSPIHGPHAAHLVPTPFEPPPYPPPRDRWESNDEARRCRVCRQVYFGMVRRRKGEGEVGE